MLGREPQLQSYKYGFHDNEERDEAQKVQQVASNDRR